MFHRGFGLATGGGGGKQGEREHLSRGRIRGEVREALERWGTGTAAELLKVLLGRAIGEGEGTKKLLWEEVEDELVAAVRGGRVPDEEVFDSLPEGVTLRRGLSEDEVQES